MISIFELPSLLNKKKQREKKISVFHLSIRGSLPCPGFAVGRRWIVVSGTPTLPEMGFTS